MIEIFKNRIKKTYLVASYDVSISTLRKIARKRFNNRPIAICKGYISGELLYLEKPDNYDRIVRVAFSK